MPVEFMGPREVGRYVSLGEMSISMISCLRLRGMLCYTGWTDRDSDVRLGQCVDYGDVPCHFFVGSYYYYY